MVTVGVNINHADDWWKSGWHFEGISVIFTSGVFTPKQKIRVTNTIN